MVQVYELASKLSVLRHSDFDERLGVLGRIKTSVNEVKDVPPGFKKWCSDNMTRAKESSSVPYWVRDNFKKGVLRTVFVLCKVLGISQHFL